MNRTIKAEIVAVPRDEDQKSFLQMIQSSMTMNGQLGIGRVLESRFRLVTAAKIRQLKQQQTKAQTQLEEVVQQIEDWLETDSQKRAVTFQSRQTAALAVWEIKEDDVAYSVVTSICDPPARRGKKRQEGREYDCYMAKVTVTTANRAIDSWTGSFAISRRFKLTAVTIRRLQRRDELQEQLNQLASSMRQIKVDEASMVDRMKLLADEKMSLQMISAVPELAQAMEEVGEEIMHDPVLLEIYGEENLLRLSDDRKKS